MPVEIVLVRHGQSEGNRDRVFTGHGPSRLTDLGRRQAEATAQAIAARKVDFIYSSDLIRCVETAAPLERLTGIRPVETAALRERDVGEFTGLPFAAVMARWPEGWKSLLNRDAEWRPPGGESHRDCSARVGAFLDELLARHTSGLIAVYSHGVAINHLLRHVLGMHLINALGRRGHEQPEGEPIGHETIDHSGAQLSARAYFQVENCSIQRIEHRAEYRTFRILSVNETNHIAPSDRTQV